jgi:hypothetical protein
MTEPTDDLFGHLSAADPVAGQSLPSADDPSAQQILENAMNQNDMNQNDLNQQGQERRVSPIAAAGDENPYAWPLTDASATSPSAVAGASGPATIEGRSRRNPLMLLSAAAAVLLLVGGLLVFSPDNTPSAVAAVHSAAASTADADSARVTTTWVLDGTDGVDEQNIIGQFDAAYSGENMMFTVDIAEQNISEFPEELPVTEGRLVDDVLYVDFDGQWFAIDTEGLIGETFADIVDPRVVLDTVQGLTETEEVGAVTIDGVETTHYQSVVDLGEESLVKSGWLAFDGLEVDTDGEVTIDLYVADDGVLRQFDLTGNIEDTTGTGESGTFDVSTRFYDIGADITVEAPADVETVDPLQGLFGEN